MGHKHSFQDCLLELIVYLSKKKYHLCEYDRDKVTAYFSTVSSGGILVKGDIDMAELREGQFFNVGAAFKTQSGNPATYEAGSVAWTSSDPSVASVEVNPDNELQAKVSGVNGSANGSAVIEFRADGDPDADQTRELIATLAVTVTQGEAVVAELTAGAAQDNPAIPTPGPDPEPEPAPPEPVPSPDLEPPVPTETSSRPKRASWLIRFWNWLLRWF